jgi:hypothetical protein
LAQPLARPVRRQRSARARCCHPRGGRVLGCRADATCERWEATAKGQQRATPRRAGGARRARVWALVRTSCRRSTPYKLMPSGNANRWRLDDCCTVTSRAPSSILLLQRSATTAPSGLRLFGRGRPESRRERVMSVRQRVWGAKMLRGALSPRTWSRAEERQSARAQRPAGTVRARGSVCTWAGRGCGGARVRQSIGLPHGWRAGRGPRARIGRSVRGQAEQRSSAGRTMRKHLNRLGLPLSHPLSQNAQVPRT